MINEAEANTDGMVRTWSNPDDTFKESFVSVRVSGILDPYAGIAIIAQGPDTPGIALAVANLRRELPALLLQHPKGTVVFWRRAIDGTIRAKLLEELTASPVYADYRNSFPSSA